MRILLVEDDRDLSGAIARMLQLHDYEVSCAYDGIEALEALAANADFQLIIMDIMMPRLDGMAALKRMRHDGVRTPILMLTAKADVDDRVSGLDAGANDYLPKPFAMKELMARIRALTRRFEESAPLRLGNLTLTPSTFELSAKTSLRLTNKEYKLMEYLLLNHGMYLSTERIMEHVWDYDSEAEINVVWVFISALRKKLESIGADHTIKAARGVGYRLEKKDDQ
ncbi:MAG: response regulator transcription factor [Clostridia bacterium]|nr:response regulator transcription factor [Clostridia bacterium]